MEKFFTQKNFSEIPPGGEGMVCEFPSLQKKLQENGPSEKVFDFKSKVDRPI
ncbi:MAG: hypothetical protein IPN72_03470 [Saprospiraceae bacterium]|nr:hypothetical protein [Saprospiraceae bacterium]